VTLSVAEIRQNFLQRIKTSYAANEHAAIQARATLCAVVEALTREFGAKRIVLFGSLSAGIFRVDSDIDLLVEGIDDGRFMSAMARATEIAGRRVDLVDPLWADAALIRAAETAGEILYVAG